MASNGSAAAMSFDPPGLAILPSNPVPKRPGLRSRPGLATFGLISLCGGPDRGPERPTIRKK